jgi:hypothetical protein
MALVKTASGFTPRHPHGKLTAAGPSVYAEWRTLARGLAEKANDRLAKLGDIEATRGKGYVKYNEFEPEAKRLLVETQELPVTFVADADTWEDAIEVAQNVAVDAVRLVEQADYSMLYYGTQPPPFGLGQASPSSGLGVLGTIGVFAAIGVAVAAMVYLIRASRTVEPAVMEGVRAT